MVRVIMGVMAVVTAVGGVARAGDDPEARAQMRATLKGVQKVKVEVKVNAEATKAEAATLFSSKDVANLVATSLKTAGIQVDDNSGVVIRVYVTLAASPRVVGAYGVRAEVAVRQKYTLARDATITVDSDTWWQAKVDVAEKPEDVKQVLLTNVLNLTTLAELVQDWKAANP